MFGNLVGASYEIHWAQKSRKTSMMIFRLQQDPLK